MNKSQQSPTPEELKNLEADTVWTLLDEASQQNASPLFADKIMDEIRSEVTDKVVTSPSFWKRYSLPISAAAIAGIAACVMITLSSNDPTPSNTGEVAVAEFSDEELAFIAEEMAFDQEATTATTEIDTLADQIMEIENEDPFFMTADDINVLVSM